LQKGTVGIDSLRERLSRLLFEHVKQELPKLYSDLNKALDDSKQGLSLLGNRRSSPEDCREYLMQLSLEFHEVCGAAAKGQYEGSFFRYDSDTSFTLQLTSVVRCLRAMVQKMNTEFSTNLRTTGHTYFMDRSGGIILGELGEDDLLPPPNLSKLVTLLYTESPRWVIRAIIRNRGREL
jgi:hypothetical protein